MPKRLIDGEALWKSRKLKRVSLSYRAEYANLIPLAEVNGVFEYDPHLIWLEVYAFNRPDISLEDVVQIMDEFERAEMLTRWEEDGKWWGHWTGIEKRLPAPSALKRGDYKIKNGVPNPPCGPQENHNDTTSESQHRFRFKLGSGEGLSEEKIEMRRRTFEAICHRYGLAPDPKGYSSWSDLAGICEGLGDRTVEAAFEEWASKEPDAATPIATFVKIAPKLTRKVVVVEENPKLKEFCHHVTKKSSFQIIFNKAQKSEVSELLDQYPYSEIVLAFDKFYDIIKDDSYQLKFGAKDFVEKGPQILETTRLMKAEAEAQEKQIAEIKSKVQATAALEHATEAVGQLSDAEIALDVFGEDNG